MVLLASQRAERGRRRLGGYLARGATRECCKRILSGQKRQRWAGGYLCPFAGRTDAHRISSALRKWAGLSFRVGVEFPLSTVANDVSGCNCT